jgi:hypothetical protein
MFPAKLMTRKCNGNCGNTDPHDGHLSRLYKLYLWLKYDPFWVVR